MTVLHKNAKKLKADLLQSSRMFAAGEMNPSLRWVLDKLHPGVGFAVVFNWIAEQGEDIYWLLVNKNKVLIVDVPRQGCDESVAALEVFDVSAFQKRRLSAETRRRFEVALEIVNEKINTN